MPRRNAEQPILIVEDDSNTSHLVATYLQRDGFTTVEAADGHQALAAAEKQEPLLVVLDVMIPGIDGWEVCRQLRKRSDVPILFLSAREEEIDRVMGLSLGADDYVVKPFSPRELVERVKAILRRTQPVTTSTEQNVMVHGDLEVDREKLRVRLAGETVELTAAEFKLLQAMMATPGRVFSRQELLDQLYPHGESVVDRVVDVHVGKLRQKLEKDAAKPEYIITVRGFGYRFADRGDG